MAAVATLALLLASHHASDPPSRKNERLRVQKQVAVLFAGIPQHGVILGRPAAPVTLQVFVDLEDHGDGTLWFDFVLPAILERFGRTNLIRLEFHSLKTDTLNGGPFITQQTAALAAGAQNKLWNYVATFMNEQGQEFTNYATETFIIGIAKQVPGLNIAKWEKSRTTQMSKIVMADNYNARHHHNLNATPAFRIGLTGGHMKTLTGENTLDIHKYIIHKRPSGERYIAGTSPELQQPVSLINTNDLQKALIKLLCQQHAKPCPKH